MERTRPQSFLGRTLFDARVIARSELALAGFQPKVRPRPAVVSSAERARFEGVVRRLSAKAGIESPARIEIGEDAPGFDAFAESSLFKSRRSITISKSTLQTLNDERLDALVAHELGHIALDRGAQFRRGLLRTVVQYGMRVAAAVGVVVAIGVAAVVSGGVAVPVVVAAGAAVLGVKWDAGWNPRLSVA